ncbi:MAG: helix-turn-helix domain-containing protein [Candidatus Methanomethylophilaceae archaeon]|nr:helix-turn-helix domain-containing protein [Candidatus Methanomethylophilaceae archaeon]
MVMHSLTKRDKDIKKLLLSGWSANKIANKKRISRQTVYRITDKLVFLKELYVIPGTNPKCYVDRNPEESIETKPDIEKMRKTGLPSQKTDLPPLVPSNDPGISFDEKCPQGDQWWEAHMTSGIKFTVEHEGDYSDPRDRNGFYIGYWKKEEPTKMKGTRIRTGGMKLHNTETTWQVRIGTKNHKLTFFFYPGRIYIDITKFPTGASLVPIFKDRALEFAEVMKSCGWVLTNPIIKGTIHKAKPGHRAIEFFDKDAQQFDTPDLIVDTSNGTPELEMENMDSDPLAFEKSEVMAYLPSRILGIEAQLRTHSASIEQLIERSDRVLILLDKLVDGQEKLSALEALAFDNQVTRYENEYVKASGDSEQNLKQNPEPNPTFPLEGYF